LGLKSSTAFNVYLIARRSTYRATLSGDAHGAVGMARRPIKRPRPIVSG